MNVLSYYVTPFGKLNISTRELNGYVFPQDDWSRAFRLQAKFGRDAFEYLAQLWEYRHRYHFDSVKLP